MSQSNPRMGFAADFPVGLRVMAIDPDLDSLYRLKVLLEECNFTVLHDTSATNALKRISDENESCHIIITELHTLDMDAVEFLEHMTQRAPVVVVLSCLDDKDMAVKALAAGVAEYMVKPATLEKMKDIWNHVVRLKLKNSDFHIRRNPNRKRHCNYNPNPNPNLELIEGRTNELQQIVINSEGNHGDSNLVVKGRISWEGELHDKFVEAVNGLNGPDFAKPKKIWEKMNIRGLSRDQVASHLQKYKEKYKSALRKEPTQQRIWMYNKEASTSNGIGSTQMPISNVIGNIQFTTAPTNRQVEITPYNRVENSGQMEITPYNGVENSGQMEIIPYNGVGNAGQMEITPCNGVEYSEQMEITPYNGVGNSEQMEITSYNGVGNSGQMEVTHYNGVRNSGQMDMTPYNGDGISQIGQMAVPSSTIAGSSHVAFDAPLSYSYSQYDYYYALHANKDPKYTEILNPEVNPNYILDGLDETYQMFQQSSMAPMDPGREIDSYIEANDFTPDKPKQRRYE